MAYPKRGNRLTIADPSSSKTVAAHVQHILGKLGVHSRTQAVAPAYRRGLLNGRPADGGAVSAAQSPPQ
jgi:hypothetical protein